MRVYSPEQQKTIDDRWIKEEKRSRTLRWVRRAFGGILLVIPFIVVASGLYSLMSLFLVFTLAGGAVLLSPDLATFLSSHAGSILWSRKTSADEPVYGIARTLAARGEYMAAEREYDEIIAEFPDVALPHVELIEIAVMRLNNAELAEKLFQRGMSTLRSKEQRDRLTVSYERVRSRLRAADHLVPKKISGDKVQHAREHFDERRKNFFQ